jgi:hypothetical protein
LGFLGSRADDGILAPLARALQGGETLYVICVRTVRSRKFSHPATQPLERA